MSNPVHLLLTPRKAELVPRPIIPLAVEFAYPFHILQFRRGLPQ
jgi:hypothetical protein